MRLVTAFLLVFGFISTRAQSDSAKAVQENILYQKEQDADYKNAGKSPLEPKARKKFKGHSFYPIDLKYRVVAKLRLTANSQFTPMRTSTSRLRNYRVFAMADFTLAGRTFSVPIYQSQDLLHRSLYADYLFFPFTDLTNDKETYSGGRYIDLRIPKGDELIIDFNKAYNPYCAYSHKYSCPIVPSENHLDIEVRAGIKLQNKN